MTTSISTHSEDCDCDCEACHEEMHGKPEETNNICPHCNGAGYLPHEFKERCPNCKGQGEI